MFDPLILIDDLPAYDRDLVRWMLAGLADSDKPLGWYGFSSVGMDWISELLVAQGLASRTTNDYGTAYIVTDLGRQIHAQLDARHGTQTEFPKRAD